MVHVPLHTDDESRAAFLTSLFEDDGPLFEPPEGQHLDGESLQPLNKKVLGDPLFADHVSADDWMLLGKWFQGLAVKLDPDPKAEYLWDSARKCCELSRSGSLPRRHMGPFIRPFVFDSQLRVRLIYALSQFLSSEPNNPAVKTEITPSDPEAADCQDPAGNWIWKRWLEGQLNDTGETYNSVTEDKNVRRYKVDKKHISGHSSAGPRLLNVYHYQDILRMAESE